MVPAKIGGIVPLPGDDERRSTCLLCLAEMEEP